MEYPKPDTHVKIITEDSLQAKAHSLGVEGSVKLSLIGGLINIDGSAKFADDSNKSNHVTRLTLKYHTTTKFKELTMNHLGAGRIRHPELFDSNIATHVVTGVLYGAEAFFIFDRVISEEENKKEVAGTLHAVINKIPMCKIEAEVKLNLNENERNFVDKLNCTFYGDFKLDTNPRNFEDAIRIYADLPKYLGDKQQNAVPKKVSLYPLHRLDSKAMKIVRDISSSVVDYCVNFLQDLQVLEIRVLDLTTSKMFTYFSYMQQQLSDFAARLSELDRDLKKQMISILPTVRGGGSEESALLTLFKKVDISPFNKQKLTSWVEDKEKEVSLMEQFISALTKNSKANITVKSSSLNDTIGDLSYEYILCLSFRFTDEQDPQLEDMSNYLQGTDGLNSGKANLAWFKNSSVLSKTRTSLRQFIEFAASNANTSSNIKFVVNEEYPTDSVKQALLVLYENGVPNESFVIPSKPKAPRKTNATDDSITLAWDDAQIGSEEIKYYEIMYLYVSAEKQVVPDENSPGAWTAVATDDAKKEKHISNLPAGVPFLFKVRSVTEIGVSVFSENSQIILTLGTVVHSLRASSIDIHPNARWQQNGLTVAGGNGDGNGINQLYNPCGLYVDDDQTIYVADQYNHRIVEWKRGATNGQVVADGNGEGSGTHQLSNPLDVIVDKETDSLIICDYLNERVVRWPRRNGTSGETIISNIDCWGLTMDENGSLYIIDNVEHEVRRYGRGESQGTVVAGGNGSGNRLDQFYCPQYVFVDRNNSVYVSDGGNDRVMKWVEGAKQGVVVAGGQGKENGLTQLWNPRGVVVDELGTIYVADGVNNRVMRWTKGATQGSVIVGGNGRGGQSNQLNGPSGLSFDRHGNLYVVDFENHRVQKFNIESNK
ncbi:unnamed protein product [Rotaria sordida]|uniref:Fibronectin type-III domain-containing protein n=1 Tax=Rotaria sordida TaxID=392033 RepID=A0A815YP03_9BILA|nr:unnamed protein product [Rotaria sordida]CAF1573429.1 unnamed protein product [Rotaria sordida]